VKLFAPAIDCSPETAAGDFGLKRERKAWQKMNSAMICRFKAAGRLPVRYKRNYKTREDASRLFYIFEEIIQANERSGIERQSDAS
jgi:hypothetical protein